MGNSRLADRRIRLSLAGGLDILVLTIFSLLIVNPAARRLGMSSEPAAS